MATYYDRYADFRVNGEVKPLPGIIIPESSTDKAFIYRVGNSRLDKISLAYYNTPWCGWLIMLANPEYGGLEFNIPDSASLKIPYPFESGIDRYISEINTHKALYGE